MNFDLTWVGILKINFSSLPDDCLYLLTLCQDKYCSVDFQPIFEQFFSGRFKYDLHSSLVN